MYKVFFFLTAVLLLNACQPGQQDVYNILDYGARGDSATMCTDAINEAITEASENGGGKVIVPPGIYLTGTIVLKDNVVFEVQYGATIAGSGNREDYTRERRPMYRYHKEDPALQMMHLILVKNCKNVTLCGGGTIYGNGKEYWKPFDKLPAWIHAQPDRVSNMVEVQYSENIKIRDLFMTMSPEWTLHVVESKGIEINGVKIDNGFYGPNNDGIDITSCQDVVIANCDIKTCDDAICFKASVDGGPCERATVTNCLVQTNCVALKVGSNLTFHPIRDITFSNCVITHSSRAIGLYSTKGSMVENVNFSNIVAKTNAPLVINRPIHLSAWNKSMYEWEPPQSSAMRNITISNFTAETDGRILMTAEEGCTMENITLRDIKLHYPRIEDPKPIAPGHESHQGSPKNPVARGVRAAVVADNISELIIDGLSVGWPADTVPEEWLIPERIENGTNRRFNPENYDYKKPRQTEMHVFWGRNIDKGYLFAPYANASSTGKKDFMIVDSDFTIRK